MLCIQRTRKIVTKNSNPRPNSNCKQNRNDIPEKRNCGNEIKSCLPTIKTSQPPRFRIFIPKPPPATVQLASPTKPYVHPYSTPINRNNGSRERFNRERVKNPTKRAKHFVALV